MVRVSVEQLDDWQDFLEPLMSARGWSMRRGYLKKQGLLKPKRGKAAIRAELQGQGREVFRGRSCFKRSCFLRYPCYSRPVRDSISVRRNDLHRFATEEARSFFQQDAVQDMDVFAHDNQDAELVFSSSGELPLLQLAKLDRMDDASTTVSDLSTEHVMEYDGEDYGLNLSDVQGDMIEAGSTRFWNVTVTEVDAFEDVFQSQVKSSASVDLPEEAFKKNSSAWRWELAVAKAECAMQNYKPATSTAIRITPSRREVRLEKQNLLEKERRVWQKQSQDAWNLSMSMRRRRRRLEQKSAEVDVHRLISEHQALVENGASPGELQESINSTFSSFQQGFLKEHGTRICSGLSQVFQGARAPKVHLNPASLSTRVQLRFLKACAQLRGSVLPVFHGTKPHNIQSIFDSGLLIPGRGNHLQVAHGSAHGLGIYTASLDNASLSYGFGGKQGMLICGVLDDAKKLSEPLSCGYRQIVAESEQVRHVGGAVVVFEQQRVVPLFHAEIQLAKQAKRYMSTKQSTRQRLTKKKQRTLEIAKRKPWIPAFYLRNRQARRRRRVSGLGRCGVGAVGF